MIVNFYHLDRSPIERVLPNICQSLLGSGERVLIVAGEEALGRLDEQLWTWSRDSFLPHGRERPESQPILLAAEPVAANGARAVALADGIWRDEARGFERAYFLFGDGGLDGARDLWRRLKAQEGVERRYWKQDEDGRWVQGP